MTHVLTHNALSGITSTCLVVRLRGPRGHGGGSIDPHGRRERWPSAKALLSADQYVLPAVPASHAKPFSLVQRKCVDCAVSMTACTCRSRRTSSPCCWPMVGARTNLSGGAGRRVGNPARGSHDRDKTHPIDRAPTTVRQSRPGNAVRGWGVRVQSSAAQNRAERSRGAVWAG